MRNTRRLKLCLNLNLDFWRIEFPDPIVIFVKNRNKLILLVMPAIRMFANCIAKMYL